MAEKLDLIGQKFGRLTVLERRGSNASHSTLWLCRCDCGNEIIAVGKRIKYGATKSCGCYKRDLIGALNLTHGQQRKGNKTAEHRAWRHIKSRCYNANVWNYHNYGGRGIGMYDGWRNSFELFFKDVGPRPSSTHSIDRYPNVNGNYEPGNCRWATKAEQARGQRSNHWIEYDGKRMILADWAIFFKISSSWLHKQLKTKTFTEVYNKYK